MKSYEQIIEDVFSVMLESRLKLQIQEGLKIIKILDEIREINPLLFIKIKARADNTFIEQLTEDKEILKILQCLCPECGSKFQYPVYTDTSEAHKDGPGKCFKCTFGPLVLNPDHLERLENGVKRGVAREIKRFKEQQKK